MYVFIVTLLGRAPRAAREIRLLCFLVSVLNEIHHQQNSIQINKILHEHGIKHKIKENTECRDDANK